MAIVYLITNTLDGKRYVGRTARSLETRWNQHRRAALRGDTAMLITRALTKHGLDAFKIECLEECAGDAVGARERHWITELHTHVRDGGYNLTEGGDGGLPGYVFSDETRQKLREKATGRVMSPDAVERMRQTKIGRKQDPEVVERRRQKLIGKKRTPEQIERLAAANRGKTRSEESKRRIGDAARGHVVSTETRERLRVAHLGGECPQTTKDAVSRARSKAVVLIISDTERQQFRSLKEASEVTGTPVLSIQRSLSQKRAVAGRTWQLPDSETKNGDL